MSWRGVPKKAGAKADMKSLIDNFKLQDPTLLEPVREFPEYTVVMTTLWPNLIIQQQSNTLAIRQLITRGPAAFELAWTYFGYAEDDEDITRRRLRQANLMGPAGCVSFGDSGKKKILLTGAGAGAQWGGGG